MTHHSQSNRKQHFLQLLVFASGTLVWFSPVPAGLEPDAWHLFAVFISAIFAVIIEAMPIFTASIIALAVVVLTGTVPPKAAYNGFSKDIILLIIAAFLVARGVIKSGLAKRIALLIIKKFGRSSLGLAYSIIAADMLVAPAFPSNTARSGMLFSIVNALAVDSGSKVADGTRKKLGAFLMMASMAGITLSSAMWLTAMAANSAGAEIAEKNFGVTITFDSWALAASVPIIILFFLIPWVLMRIYPPEIKETPNAPAIAEQALSVMGPMHKNEWIVAVVCITMILLWAMSESLCLDRAAVAFLGLGVLMLANIFTLEDLHGEGRTLETLVWFSILLAMSACLTDLGFMKWAGAHVSDMVSGFSWFIIYACLIIGYVLIHYFFVSQTAQLIAIFGVFLEIAQNSGVPVEMMAMMLLFATNFSAIITPQGSSANAIYISSGYLKTSEVYKIGGIITLINTTVFLTVGTAWMLLIL